MYATWNTTWCSKSGAPRGAAGLPSPDKAAEKDANTLLRKVLVVDDEPDLAEFAAALLGAHGLAVVVAHSGHEAIQRLQDDDEIDAVFSDVMMPGMTGVQLADAVRAMYPRVKIVLASGYALPELLAGRERPYLFATKPYRIDTILKLLRS
jgi:two-component system OmpR family response regulator